MAEEKKKKKGNYKDWTTRQEWNPPWIVKLLYHAWMIVFGAFKIALGAAATVAIICGICLMVFAGAVGDYLEEDILPNVEADLDRGSMEEISTLYYVDADGNIQTLQQVYAALSREWVSIDQIPEDLIHAAVAIEDKRFFEHQGVDWVTTIRACAKMFFGDASMGGSTITQQLMKNYYQDDSITVQRKVREIFRATQLEKKYDKATILEWYLNTIYLGNGTAGVKSAAAAYFGKELEMLTTAECASLISITNNPSLFDPYGEEFEYDGRLQTGMERNKGRQELVLREMLNQGWLTQAEYNEAVAQELVLKSGIDFEDKMAYCETEGCGYHGLVKTLTPSGDDYLCPQCGQIVPVERENNGGVYSFFVDTVLEDLAQALAERDGLTWDKENKLMRKLYMDKIQTGGYHIYTTFNAEAQAVIDNLYNNPDNMPEGLSGQQLQSAAVLINNRTGDIIAMAGKVGEKEFFDEFNRATDAEVQSGSAIKPLSVYAPAFELGIANPATVMPDMPLSYDGGAYPLNDDRIYTRYSTVANGLYNSVNAVTAWTLYNLGIDNGFYFARDKFRLSTLVEEEVTEDGTVLSDKNTAALALGAQTYGVTVRDMATAFATFANNGEYRRARTFTKVYDRDGNLVLDNTQEREQILSEKTVNYVNYCLEKVLSTTGSGADFAGQTEYGKTGTADNETARWFCGFTAYYTAAVWFGYDQPEHIYGSNPAPSTWRKIMEPLHEGLERVQMYSLDGMSYYTICKDSGKFATEACSQDVRSGYNPLQGAYAYPEDVSGGSCDKHVLVDYCTTGGGVATEYCKKFAAEEGSSIKIEKKALVKLTQSELDEIRRGVSVGLSKIYLQNDYIYLINSDGSDASFKGVSGSVNENVNAPYMVCPLHTKEAWEKYQKEKEEATRPTETEPAATAPATTVPPAA